MYYKLKPLLANFDDRTDPSYQQIILLVSHTDYIYLQTMHRMHSIFNAHFNTLQSEL